MISCSGRLTAGSSGSIAGSGGSIAGSMRSVGNDKQEYKNKGQIYGPPGGALAADERRFFLRGSAGPYGCNNQETQDKVDKGPESRLRRRFGAIPAMCTQTGRQTGIQVWAIKACAELKDSLDKYTNLRAWPRSPYSTCSPRL